MRYVHPAKRPGRPQGTPERLRRMVHTEEARHREIERPFDPEAPREHYARPHHFAVNAPRHGSLGPLEDYLPGRQRFMVVAVERDGARSLATHGLMSIQEAGAWAAANLQTPFEIRGYVKGSEDDPRMQAYQPNAFTSGPMDQHAATDLVLFIENTADLSLDGPRGQGHSVLLNALRKFRKGTYNPTMAVKLFEYLTDAGARRYVQENRSSLPWNTMFTVPTRREAARQLEESFRSSAEQGEYDSVDTRIGQ